MRQRRIIGQKVRVIGQKVRVTECSGIDSGKIGEIIPRSLIKTNRRGCPMLPGHYRTMTELSDHLAVRTTSGEILLMSRHRLICI